MKKKKTKKRAARKAPAKSRAVKKVISAKAALDVKKVIQAFDNLIVSLNVLPRKLKHTPTLIRELKTVKNSFRGFLPEEKIRKVSARKKAENAATAA